MRRGTQRVTAFVDAVVSHGVQELMAELGTAEPAARQVMRKIAHRVCGVFQRQWVYVPVDLEYVLDQRDEEIWRQYGTDSATSRKFSPQRLAELAAQYELTTVQMYFIVRLMRERERAQEARDFASRQGVLPGLEPGAEPDSGQRAA